MSASRSTSRTDPEPGGPPAPAVAAAAATATGEWVGPETPGFLAVLSKVPGLPRKVLEHRDLVVSSVVRELRGRFYGTLLGWAWPLVYPVFMFAVYYFVFAQLLQLKLPGTLDESLKAAMGIYMFVGVLVWTGFAEGLLRAGNVIIENGNLIKKLSFPTELLPLNATLVAAVTMLFGVGIFVVVLWLSVAGRALGLWEHALWPDAPGLGLLWVPVLLFVQLLFTYGFGLLLATLQVFLRDTMHLMGILVLTWMFITPVFWIASDKVIAGISTYADSLQINPMYHLMRCWREVLMVGQPDLVFAHEPPFLHSLGVFSLWAIGFFLVGYLFFLRSQRRFADEV